MNWFLSLFAPTKKYAFEISFHMKSGEVIKAQCASFNYKTSNNNLVEYEFTEKKPGDALYIRMDDVSCISSKEL